MLEYSCPLGQVFPRKMKITLDHILNCWKGGDLAKAARKLQDALGQV